MDKDKEVESEVMQELVHEVEVDILVHELVEMLVDAEDVDTMLAHTYDTVIGLHPEEDEDKLIAL